MILENRSNFEALLSSDDASASVLSYLSVNEVVAVSLVSKSCRSSSRCDALWKLLLERRWNTDAASCQRKYYEAYRRAFQNPHDLWITHCNIVWPWEGLVSGQCGIVVNDGDEKTSIRSTRKRPRSLPEFCYCPSCRLENSVKDGSSEKPPTNHVFPRTRAQGLAEATRLVRCKLASLQPDYTPPTKCQSQRAFARATTLQRTIDTRQYIIDEECHFLEDLLFFPVDPVWQQDVYEDACGSDDESQERPPSSLHSSSLPPPYSTHRHDALTNHSWHVVRLANPTHRPMVFEIVMQQPDYFAAYPNQGYLPPGESVHVVFSVMSTITKQGAFSTVELPFTPYLVRYRFAVQVPLFHSEFMARPIPTIHEARTRRAVSENVAVSETFLEETRRVLDYHWQQEHPAHAMRSIPLAAHVQSQISLHEFWEETCWPIWGSWARVPTYIAPALQVGFPSSDAFKILSGQSPGERREEEAVKKQLLCGVICGNSGGLMAASLEGQADCSTRWGHREEELYHAYVVMRGECAYMRQRKLRLVKNLLRVISALETMDIARLADSSEQLERVWVLLRRIAEQWQTICGVIKDRQERKELEDAVLLGARVECLVRKVAPMRLADESRRLSSQTQIQARERCRCFPDTSQMYVSSDHSSDVGDFRSAIYLIRDPKELSGKGLFYRKSFPGTLIRRPRFMVPNLTLRMGDLEEEFAAQTFHNYLESCTQEYIWYCKLMNCLDVNALIDVQQKYSRFGKEMGPTGMFYSLESYLHGIPPPGAGRFPLSRLKFAMSESDEHSAIVELHLTSTFKQLLPKVSPNEPDGIGNHDSVAVPNPAEEVHAPAGARRRMFGFLSTLASQVGLTANTSRKLGLAVVDRRILIAGQWLSLACFAIPMLVSLTARFASWIPTQPLQHELDELMFENLPPDSSANDLRYLAPWECGTSALLLLVSTMFLGRRMERYTGCDYFRTMSQHITPLNTAPSSSARDKPIIWHWRAYLWILCAWDLAVPHSIQSLFVQTTWIQRSKKAARQHIAFWSGLQDTDIIFSSLAGRTLTMFGDIRDENVEVRVEPATSVKALIVLLASLWSFCSCSPHFWLNLLTIVGCSLGFGMSASLHVIDRSSNGNLSSFSSSGATSAIPRSESALSRANLVTLTIFSVLIGHLIGSSGGTMFLAEFIVTSAGFMLGGAGTVSSSAIISWIFFFGLGTVSFWASLCGRAAIMEGINRERTGLASRLLWASTVTLCLGWAAVLLFSNFLWDRPVDVVVQRFARADISKLQ